MARVCVLLVFYGLLFTNFAGQAQSEEASSHEIEVLIGATSAPPLQPQKQSAINDKSQIIETSAPQRGSRKQPLEIIIKTQPEASHNQAVVTSPTVAYPATSHPAINPIAVLATPMSKPVSTATGLSKKLVSVASSTPKANSSPVKLVPAPQVNHTPAQMTIETLATPQPRVTAAAFQENANTVLLARIQNTEPLPNPTQLDAGNNLPPAPPVNARPPAATSSEPQQAGSYPHQIITEPGPTVVGESGILCRGDGCCATCCIPKKAGFIFGGENLYLTAFDEPEQQVILTNQVTGAVHNGASDPGMGFGYRTWMGFKNCGRGYRLTYTHLGNSDQNVRPVVPTQGTPAFHENYFLSGDTVDLEVTQEFCFCQMNLQTSFGGRYGRLDRNASVYGYGDLPSSDNAAEVFGYAMGANELEAIGFTFSLGALKPMGYHCGWSAFWNWRGSMMWGDSVASALTEANTVLKVNSTAIGSANSRDKAFATVEHSENIFISEAQLGVQYCKCLCCFPATFIFNAGIEYQHWKTGDLTASSDSFATLLASPPLVGGRVDARSRAHDGDLDLIGMFIGAGFIY